MSIIHGVCDCNIDHQADLEKKLISNEDLPTKCPRCNNGIIWRF